VELNFIEQVLNLAKTSIVQRSWRREQRPVLHGWVYDPRTGLLKELAAMPPGSKIDEIYTFEWDEA
jgi:carbonic anhydrase